MYQTWRETTGLLGLLSTLLRSLLTDPSPPHYEPALEARCSGESGEAILEWRETS
jgi:hypothetical protein